MRHIFIALLLLGCSTDPAGLASGWDASRPAVIVEPTAPIGTGGVESGTGGAVQGTGGEVGTGGLAGTGGWVGTGGRTGTGGAMGLGGILGTSGAAVGTGGMVGTGGATSAPDAGWNVPGQNCDPVAQTGCGAGETCATAQNTAPTKSDYSPTGLRCKVNGPCGAATNAKPCAVGLVCNFPYCTIYCDYRRSACGLRGDCLVLDGQRPTDPKLSLGVCGVRN